MPDALSAVLTGAVGLAAGAGAGAAFFTGLAATVRRLPDTSRPVALVAGSVIARFVLLAVVLVALALLGPWSLLAGVVGVLAARTVLVRRASAGTGGSGRWS